jgi:hypothetical protein
MFVPFIVIWYTRSGPRLFEASHIEDMFAGAPTVVPLVVPPVAGKIPGSLQTRFAGGKPSGSISLDMSSGIIETH